MVSKLPSLRWLQGRIDKIFLWSKHSSRDTGMSQPPFFVRVSITVQYCDHPHNFSLDQRFWSSPVSWRQMMKQYTIGNRQNLIVSFVIESPYEVIKTGSSVLKSSIFLQFVLKVKSGVVCAPASNFPHELENTIGKDVMSIGSSLDTASCIETVKDILNFDFFPGVQINKVWSSSSSGIGVPHPQLFMCKSNAISPVSIVFIKQGNAPVITIDFSSFTNCY